MKTKIFLDLEETIIDAWDSRIFLLNNIADIKTFINGNFNFNSVELGIFSFAIWNEEDKEDFNKNLKNIIQDLFELPIIDENIVTVTDIGDLLSKKLFVNLLPFELINIWGKEKAFFDWVSLTDQKRTKRFILIDDIVRNLTIKNNTFGEETHLINVKDVTKCVII